MTFRNQLFAATCTLIVSAIPSNLAAQQTTKDGSASRMRSTGRIALTGRLDLPTRAIAARAWPRDSASATGAWST